MSPARSLSALYLIHSRFVERYFIARFVTALTVRTEVLIGGSLAGGKYIVLT